MRNRIDIQIKTKYQFYLCNEFKRFAWHTDRKRHRRRVEEDTSESRAKKLDMRITKYCVRSVIEKWGKIQHKIRFFPWCSATQSNGRNGDLVISSVAQKIHVYKFHLEFGKVSLSCVYISRPYNMQSFLCNQKSGQESAEKSAQRSTVAATGAAEGRFPFVCHFCSTQQRLTIQINTKHLAYVCECVRVRERHGQSQSFVSFTTFHNCETNERVSSLARAKHFTQLERWKKDKNYHSHVLFIYVRTCAYLWSAHFHPSLQCSECSTP